MAHQAPTLTRFLADARGAALAPDGAPRPIGKTIPLEVLAEWLAMAPEGQPWRFEGAVYHFLRHLLCLQGHFWRVADIAAARAVGRARKLNGTPDPEGWDDNDVLVSGRCIGCRRLIPITPGRLYCSTTCKSLDQRRRAA